MDEEIQTSTGPIVPQHQKERWHGRGFDHEANTEEERGWFWEWGGVDAPADELRKRHYHTGAENFSISVWTCGTYTAKYSHVCIVT